MNNLTAEPNDWEGRRPFSLAPAISAEPSNVLAGIFHAGKQSVQELRPIVIPPRHERLIGLCLFALALLSAADVWLTRLAANAAPPGYITSATVPPNDIRVVAYRPALSASMVTAASPF
jgi:hypothetical protein